MPAPKRIKPVKEKRRAKPLTESPVQSQDAKSAKVLWGKDDALDAALEHRDVER